MHRSSTCVRIGLCGLMRVIYLLCRNAWLRPIKQTPYRGHSHLCARPNMTLETREVIYLDHLEKQPRVYIFKQGQLNIEGGIAQW